MLNEELKMTVENLEQLVEVMLGYNSPKLILAACGLLRQEIEAMTALRETARTQAILALLGRLTIRAGELLGDDGPQARIVRELERESNQLQTFAAGVGV